MLKHFLFIIILFNSSGLTQKTDFDELFNKNREYLFSDLNICIKKAQKMQLLATKEKNKRGLMLSDKLYADIYILKYDYKNALKYGNKAKKIAEELNDYLEIAANSKIIGLNYAKCDLLEQALAEFNEGLDVLKKSKNENKAYLIKGNIYESIAEVYSRKDDFSTMIFNLKKAQTEYIRLKDNSDKVRVLQNTYSNIGIAYLDYNVDSSYFYFKKAAVFTNKNSQLNTVSGIYLGLGITTSKMKKYNEALNYLNRSLKVSKRVGSSELQIEANSQISEVYYALKDSIKGLNYKNECIRLKDDFAKKKSTSTNDAVNSIVNDVKNESEATKKNYYIGLFVSILIGIILLVLVFKKIKNESVIRNEKDVLLKEKLELEQELTGLDHSTAQEIEEIVALAKRDLSIFYAKFQEVFPNFSKRIVEVAPTLVLSELQLCAYLKLNFSTKEIAIYTKSSVESINQKKYRLRKKMNIPSEENMNIWMNKF
jgi:tetratricopeptide (TPR) repeat protein